MAKMWDHLMISYCKKSRHRIFFIGNKPAGDPIGRKEILDILLAAKGKTTIVFSTHILADVEKICDRIAVLHGGKLALCGTLSEIRERHRLHGFILEFGSEKEASCFENAEELKQPSISLSRNGSTVKVFLADGDMDGHFLLDVLSQKHIVPLKFAVMEPTLESLFVEVIR